MERYWSRFSADLAEREVYTVGRKLVECVRGRLKEQRDLGDLIEFGCGTGVYTACVVGQARSVLATDYSAEMVTETAKNFAGEPKVRVERADCQQLTYSDGSFDTVLMVNLIHVIPYPGQALLEAYRVLRKNGVLLVTSFSTEKMTLWRKLQLLYRYRKTFGPFPERRTMFTEASLSRMVIGAGFTLDETLLLGETTRSVFLKAVKHDPGDS